MNTPNTQFNYVNYLWNEEKAAQLTERLTGCTADQLDAVAELLYLAIKTTRTICGDLEQG